MGHIELQQEAEPSRAYCRHACPYALQCVGVCVVYVDIYIYIYLSIYMFDIHTAMYARTCFAVYEHIHPEVHYITDVINFINCYPGSLPIP